MRLLRFQVTLHFSDFGQQAHYSTPVEPLLDEILPTRTFDRPEFRSGLRYANITIQINFFFVGQLYWQEHFFA